MMKTQLMLLVMGGCVWAQTQQAAKPAAVAPKPAAAAPKPAAPKAPTVSDVDMVIQLVKSGVAESMIIQTLRGAGKVYSLAPADLLKLTQAGVSNAVMETMVDPKSTAAPTQAAVAVVNNPSVTPAPVPLTAPAPAPAVVSDRMADSPLPPVPDVPKAAKKRRLVVTPFDYSAVKNWVTFWFKNDVNIGQGIRAMMTVRMAKMGTITLLERERADVITIEQDKGQTNRYAQGSKARMGRIVGADALLLGDIVIFGRDDVKKTGAGGVVSTIVPKISLFSKEEKAVVGINFRIVDAETGVVIETGESRGESSRKSKNWGALLATNQAAVAGGAGMMSSNFEETIIGEATSDAVNKLIEQLNGRIPKLPEKKFEIEGRVASVLPNNSLYLNIGSNDGVETGDRFEILQINGEIKDPQTGDVIDVQAEKVGEFVATQVREKTTIGTYGGQGLSPSFAATPGKGYAARKVVAQ